MSTTAQQGVGGDNTQVVVVLLRREPVHALVVFLEPLDYIWWESRCNLLPASETVGFRHQQTSGWIPHRNGHDMTVDIVDKRKAARHSKLKEITQQRAGMWLVVGAEEVRERRFGDKGGGGDLDDALAVGGYGGTSRHGGRQS